MGKPKRTGDCSKQMKGVEGVSPTDKTRVILMSQVVTIVALLVLWSILRSRRSST